MPHHIERSEHDAPHTIHTVNMNHSRTAQQHPRKVHHALLDIHVMEGALICPESGRSFPVTGGIPNMLLHEDEV